MNLLSEELPLRKQEAPSRLLRRGSRGGVAILIAVVLPVMLVVMSFAIEYMHLLVIRTALQQAVDDAVLAAAKVPLTLTTTGAVDNVATSNAMARVAADTYNSNFNRTDVTKRNFPPDRPPALDAPIAPAAPFQRDPASNILSLDVTVDASILFGKILGNRFTVPVRAFSRVQGRVGGNFQVALAIDLTQSMNNDFPGTVGNKKIDALKSASSTLVTTLVPTSTTSPSVSRAAIGLVPFSTWVQLRLSDLDPADPGGWTKWIMSPDVGAAKSCSYTTECYYPCRIENADSKCLNTSLPGCMVSGCKIATFGGCTSYRDAGYRGNINDTLTRGYRGVIARCVSGLTVNLSTDRAALLDAISRLSAPATNPQLTWVPAGLTWAWQMLTPELPYAAPGRDSVEATGARRVVVLLSDGESTQAPANNAVYNYVDPPGSTIVKSLPKSDGNGFFVNWSPTMTPTTPPLENPNDVTLQLCNNMRAANPPIEIFAVLIDTPTDPRTPFQQTLWDCVDETNRPGHYFVAGDAAAYQAAFTAIANSLRSVKLLP